MLTGGHHSESTHHVGAIEALASPFQYSDASSRQGLVLGYEQNPLPAFVHLVAAVQRSSFQCAGTLRKHRWYCQISLLPTYKRHLTTENRVQVPRWHPDAPLGATPALVLQRMNAAGLDTQYRCLGVSTQGLWYTRLHGMYCEHGPVRNQDKTCAEHATRQEVQPQGCECCFSGSNCKKDTGVL